MSGRSLPSARSFVWQRLLLLNFVVLLVHQFEEYAWPGGFPATMNTVLQPSPTPDHYKLNQNSATAVNVLAAYGFYLIAVFFPTVIWLGLAPVLFGFRGGGDAPLQCAREALERLKRIAVRS